MIHLLSVCHKLSQVDRDSFATRFDVGVPLDESTKDRNDRVMILYNDAGALPNDETVARQSGANGEIPLIDDVEKATENCDVLDLVLMQQKTKRQCTPQLVCLPYSSLPF